MARALQVGFTPAHYTVTSRRRDAVRLLSPGAPTAARVWRRDSCSRRGAVVRWADVPRACMPVLTDMLSSCSCP